MFKLSRAITTLLAFLLTSAAAGAADMRLKAPPPAVPMPPPFSWTGFYIGGNLGGAWFHSDVTDSVFFDNFDDGNNNGRFIGGGQVGFNWQINNFVIGFEGEFDGISNNNNNNGNGVIIAGPGLNHAFAVTLNDTSVATAAARLGVAFDRVLWYAKVGGGWVNTNGFTVTDLNTGAAFSGGGNTFSGWLVGGGIEWAFTESWSFKFEYDFLELGNHTFTVPAGAFILGGDTFTTGNPNLQMAKVGLNYRFNWGMPAAAPVSTRY